MAAYMIVLAKVYDREKFLAGYAAEAARLVEQFGGRYLLRAPNALALEGTLGDGRSVVISEWPDLASAQRFWDSEAYRKVAESRRDICDAQVLLVEGQLT
ncbi:conserved hypothetical protein [gamma proteobacterium NOR5-3]|nr:conserved hypothetical protein [gamma proteobacterium NOR5-3]